MNKHALQTELDRVTFTPEGREALTAALLRGESGAVRRSGNWARRGMAAAVAAVVLVGSALAAAGPLWDRYFGQLDDEQQEIIQTLSQSLPAAESNGTVMTPLAAFGDQDFYYLMLEIQAPEGTVLPDYGKDEGYYQLFGDSAEEDMTLTDGAGNDIRCHWEFEWLPRNGDSRVLTAVIRLWPREGVDYSDGTDKILRIPGLWVQDPYKNYTPVLTGSWTFNIGAHTGGIESRMLDTAGITTPDENYGPLALDSLRLSPLGIRFRYSWGAPAEEGCLESPGAAIAVVMEDGSKITLANDMGAYNPEECWAETYGPFATPIDLDKAVAVRWGTAEIPLH